DATHAMASARKATMPFRVRGEPRTSAQPTAATNAANVPAATASGYLLSGYAAPSRRFTTPTTRRCPAVGSTRRQSVAVAENPVELAVMYRSGIAQTAR